MGKEITIDLDNQQTLYLKSMEISGYAQEIVSLMTRISTNLSTLSSQGYFHDRMSPDSKEGDGMARYIIKAQEFETLCEVTTQHIYKTYQRMTDTDRALAVYVLNLMLQDPKTKAAKKEEILKNQEAYVSAVEKELKASKEGAQK